MIAGCTGIQSQNLVHEHNQVSDDGNGMVQSNSILCATVKIDVPVWNLVRALTWAPTATSVKAFSVFDRGLSAVQKWHEANRSGMHSNMREQFLRS